ncbi:hypothetical protein P0136_12400 [Lentisphaerota bacterium ZTH]|nr:hypothetical protein JYG24_10085 [Lentisphaerota bacterium]WET06158.1 hypothetical protein P0136_12400 [Lentisphaerota bacterium ZTH]
MRNACKLIAIAALILACADIAMAQQNSFYKGYRQRYRHYRRTQGNNLFGVYWRDATWDQYIYLLPAHVGATVFIAAGNLVGWPCKAVYNTCRGDFTLDNFLPPVQFANKYFAPAGGYLLGGPFWVLKKGLIDGPVWVYDSIFDRPEPVDLHQVAVSEG